MSTLWIYKIVHDGVSMNLNMEELFSETGLQSITSFEYVTCLFLKRKKKRNMKKNYIVYRIIYSFLTSSSDRKHLVKQWTKPLICFNKPEHSSAAVKDILRGVKYFVACLE